MKTKYNPLVSILIANYNNEKYICRVDGSTTLPFLGIKNAVNAILQIMDPVQFFFLSDN